MLDFEHTVCIMPDAASANSLKAWQLSSQAWNISWNCLPSSSDRISQKTSNIKHNFNICSNIIGVYPILVCGWYWFNYLLYFTNLGRDIYCNISLNLVFFMQFHSVLFLFIRSQPQNLEINSLDRQLDKTKAYILWGQYHYKLLQYLTH